MKSTTIVLKVGDSIELGRFKNVSAKIKDIKKDSHGQPVILYDSQCIGSEAYISLAAEVLGKGNFGGV